MRSQIFTSPIKQSFDGVCGGNACALLCSLQCRNGPDRQTIHVGHYQSNDHNRQGVQRDLDNTLHGGGREFVQQYRHHGKS